MKAPDSIGCRGLFYRSPPHAVELIGKIFYALCGKCLRMSLRYITVS